MTHDELNDLRWGKRLTPEDRAIWLALIGDKSNKLPTKKQQVAICAYPSYLHTGADGTRVRDENKMYRIEYVKREARRSVWAIQTEGMPF